MISKISVVSLGTPKKNYNFSFALVETKDLLDITLGEFLTVAFVMFDSTFKEFPRNDASSFSFYFIDPTANGIVRVKIISEKNLEFDSKIEFIGPGDFPTTQGEYQAFLIK